MLNEHENDMRNMCKDVLSVEEKRFKIYLIPLNAYIKTFRLHF